MNVIDDDNDSHCDRLYFCITSFLFAAILSRTFSPV